MKKILSVLFCLSFCLAFAFMLPNLGVTYTNVDDTGCIADGCHSASVQHSNHSSQECGVCHEGGTGQAGNVAASTCATAACHVGKCEIANAHDPARNTSCLACHADCAAGDDDDNDTGDDDDDDTDTSPCPGTAIYGEDSEEIEILKDFRDDVLAKTAGGQKIIAMYYKLAPVISEAMEENEALRSAAKTCIDALLIVLK